MQPGLQEQLSPLSLPPAIALTLPEVLQGPCIAQDQVLPRMDLPGAVAWWVRGFSVPLAPICALGWEASLRAAGISRRGNFTKSGIISAHLK